VLPKDCKARLKEAIDSLLAMKSENSNLGAEHGITGRTENSQRTDEGILQGLSGV
jgi:hypothetical protein